VAAHGRKTEFKFSIACREFAGSAVYSTVQYQ
jgi:hypothetical protein